MPLYDYIVEQSEVTIEVIHPPSLIPRVLSDLFPYLESLPDLPGTASVVRQIGGRVFVNGNLNDLSKGKVIQPKKKPLGGCPGC